MKKVTKNVIATIKLEVSQEVDFTEDELKQLEAHLEDNSDISRYIREDGGLKINPLWNILYSKIDFDCAECC